MQIEFTQQEVEKLQRLIWQEKYLLEGAPKFVAYKQGEKSLFPALDEFVGMSQEQLDAGRDEATVLINQLWEKVK